LCCDVLCCWQMWFDVSDEGSDKIQRFKKWFWSIVEKMSPSERQDLVSRVSSVIINDVWRSVKCRLTKSQKLAVSAVVIVWKQEYCTFEADVHEDRHFICLLLAYINVLAVQALSFCCRQRDLTVLMYKKCFSYRKYSVHNVMNW